MKRKIQDYLKLFKIFLPQKSEQLYKYLKGILHIDYYVFIDQYCKLKKVIFLVINSFF